MRAIGLAFLLAVSLLAPAWADDGYFYARAGIGKNEMLFTDDDEWEDQGELGCSLGVGYRHHWAGHWHGDFNFTHNSQCLAGPPADDDWETESDHLYYYVEYRWD